jgi:predicted PolB exonuclease-like 3'-5' exonuclease
MSKKDIIFLDFETVTNLDKPEIVLPSAPTAKDVKVGNLKDEAKKKTKIEEGLPKLLQEHKEKCKAIEDKAIEQWKKGAVHPLKCKVISCAVAVNDKYPVVLVGTEEEIMKQIDELISGCNMYFTIVAHNAMGFEAPILVLRALKYKLACRQQFSRREDLNSAFYDTMKRASVTDYKAYHSMDDLCTFFGIETPKGEFNGSMVHDAYFHEGEEGMQKIIKYGIIEIIALKELYYILNE